MQRLYSFVTKHTTLKWAQNYLTLLKKARYDRHNSEFIKKGFGFNWQMLKTRKGFNQLDFKALEINY